MNVCKGQLVKIFEKIEEIEGKLSQNRGNLKVNCKDLDRFEHFFITGADIINYLGEQGIMLSEPEANLFIANWDWDEDGKLTYDEFLNWADVKEYSEVSTNDLGQMLYSEIKGLQELEAEKFKLNQIEGFNTLDLFTSIEAKNSSISSQNFQTYIKENTNNKLTYFNKIFKRICKSDALEIHYFEFTDFLLYNKAYFFLCDNYPDLTLNPLSLNYSVYKSIIERTPERSEIFSISPQKPSTSSYSITDLENQNQKIEKLKVTLALKKDFTIKGLFKYFAGKKKTVNEFRLQKGLQKLGIENGEVFYYLNTNFNNELNEENFFDAFAPSSEGYKLLLRNRAKQSVEIGKETMNLIGELFKEFIKLS